MEIKQAVFAELDEVTPGHAILASNTSALSITEIGAATLRPDKVVGFHFFYPASVLPLVEVDRRRRRPRARPSPTAFNFAQAIRKQPITCEEVPGFVVNRILNSAVGEIWRAQEEQGLSIKKIDEGVGGQTSRRWGRSCSPTCSASTPSLHVAEHLHESYGDRFYVHKGMKKLVADGKLGAKTGGEGFYKDGEPNIEGDADPTARSSPSCSRSRRCVEACLMLEEGVCTVREIDLGHDGRRRPRPAPRPLPAVLEGRPRGPRRDAREAREARGEARRALRAAADPEAARRPGPPRPQGRPGLLRLPAARRRRAGDTVKLETRGDVAIAWLANPPMNAISPQVIEDLGTVWEKVKADGEIRAMVVASSLPGGLLRRRRHQGVHADGRGRAARS